MSKEYKIELSDVIQFKQIDKFLIIPHSLTKKLLEMDWIKKTRKEGEYVPTKNFQFLYQGK